MKVLKVRLACIEDKIKSGEVMCIQMMEEGQRMERLFQRWLCSLEDDVGAGYYGRSSVVRCEKCRGST